MFMSDIQNTNPPEERSVKRHCPYCKELILSTAKKCRYCGEFIDKKSRNQKLKAKVVGFLGLFTALLSLFYPLREGYFYLQQKQQQRTELYSYKKVAIYFESFDSLKYAQQALNKALDLAPNDTELQRRLLVLRTQELLRQLEWNGILEPQYQTIIEELILDGYRLLQTDLEDTHRAQLLLMVARLLPQDSYWNDDEAILELYTQAYGLLPANGEVAFRYGKWLVDAEYDVHKGIGLMTQAVQISANDALYPYELAKILQQKGQFQKALPLLLRSITLLPKQQELQRIRASNFAKSELSKWLTQADEIQNIAQDEFYGLDIEARQKIIQQVLAVRKNDRRINFIAARFYFANQQYKLAQDAISQSVSAEDLKYVIRGHYLDQFELYKNILQHSNVEPDKLREIQLALDNYQQTLIYEEALETGVAGEHQYKIGLKIKKKSDADTQEGILVVKALNGYPFAKAGVKAGDRILKLAHRQAMSLMAIYRVISNFQAGTSVPLTVERNGKVIELELMIE